MKLHEATPGTGTGTSTCRTVRYPVRVPYSVRVPYLVTMIQRFSLRFMLTIVLLEKQVFEDGVAFAFSAWWPCIACIVADSLGQIATLTAASCE